jgi:glycerol uptake facilitator-like aquaporin
VTAPPAPSLIVDAPLARRVLAEFLGTGLLMTAVGSGIAVTQLSPHGDVGLQLLENAVATGLALTALILMLGPISGAHFNQGFSHRHRATGAHVVSELVATSC